MIGGCSRKKDLSFWFGFSSEPRLTSCTVPEEAHNNVRGESRWVMPSPDFWAQ